MANTQANLHLEALGPEGHSRTVPVNGGTRLFRGILVAQLLASGCLVPLTTALAGQCVGVSTHEADNTLGLDGDEVCKIEFDRIYPFDNGAGGDAFSAVSQIGAVVYASDDHTVADNSSAGTRPAVGVFMGMEVSGRVLVFVSPALAQRLAAVVALVDNTAGTADGTLAAIPNPADSPASVDALRDDLVANALPAIRNNIADLAAKVNELIARG